MKILNLKVNGFGKLENREITFGKGINLVYGKNESGKSTLLQFIMGMFYGISKNKNGKFVSDYEKYTPWKQGEFSGKISYQLKNGKTYQVFREFKKKSPQIFNEEFEDVSHQFKIDKTAGNQFFYEQTGVDEELFRSTIVSLQEEVKLGEKEQTTLIQKMSNLASTGEDTLSFQKIMNKLNKRQMEEIGSTRSQDRPINILNKRMQEIQNQKEYLSPFTTKHYEIEEEKKKLEEQIKEEENKLELLKQVKTLQEQQELDREKIKINENAILEYHKKIEILEEKEVDSKNEEETIHNKKNQKFSIEIFLVMLFLILTIGSMLIIKNEILSAVSMVLTIMLAIYIILKKYKQKIQTVEKHKIEEEISKKQTEIEVLSNTIKNLQEDKMKMQNKIKADYEKEAERIRNEYLGIIPIKTIDEILHKQAVIYDITILQNRLSENKIKLHTMQNDKIELTTKLENLIELEEEYANLQEQQEELQKRNEQIELVKSEMEKAYEIMKKNITPKFTRNLSQIIEKISFGKYKNVKLNEENGMMVEVENGNYLPAKHLSIGTIDQLYLSLRLGAGQELEKEDLPIILDETFAYWDDTRIKNIFQYLKEEEDRQIILFTCSNREREVFDELGIEYHLIEL